MRNQATKILRSPSYPSMSLEDAVDAIAKIEKACRTIPVDRSEAAKLIGYSSLSGPAAKALAALASYGLLERAGKGEARVTERAKAILYAESDEDRRENLMAAALEPPLFRDLRERFESAIDDGMLPESIVAKYLERENFNSNAVRPAARAFLGTMRFLEAAGAIGSHGIESSDGEVSPSTASEAHSVTYGDARIGDYIQWESQGAYQFKENRRVRAVDVRDGHEWVFVDDETSGIPMDQVIVQERAQVPGGLPRPTLPLSVGAPDENFSAAHEQLEYKLSDTTRVRLSVSGELGVKELRRLIRLLETQRAILVDDEGDGDEDQTDA